MDCGAEWGFILFMNKKLLEKLRGDAIAYRPSFAKVVIKTTTKSRKVKTKIDEDTEVQDNKEYTEQERFGAAGAVYLQQLIYWCDKGSRPDGFVFKSKEEIYEETGVTPREQDRIRLTLTSLGCLETKKLMANGHPTLHYKLNLENVVKIFLSHCTNGAIHTNQRCDSNTTNGTMEYDQRYDCITENTTEITTKNTTHSEQVAEPEEIQDNSWSHIVLYFYSKVAPSTTPKERFRRTTKEAALHLLSLHSEEVIKRKIDALAADIKGKQFVTRFELFCNKFDSLQNKFTPTATTFMSSKVSQSNPNELPPDF